MPHSFLLFFIFSICPSFLYFALLINVRRWYLDGLNTYLPSVLYDFFYIYIYYYIKKSLKKKW
jgi:hypothetical protein